MRNLCQRILRSCLINLLGTFSGTSLSMNNPNLRQGRYKYFRRQTLLAPSISQNPQYSETSPTNVIFFVLPPPLPAPLAPASPFLPSRSRSAHAGRPFPFPFPSSLLYPFSPLLPTTCHSPWHGLLRSSLTLGQVVCCRRCPDCKPQSYMGITRSTLPQNNGNLPLPFFFGNYPLVCLNNNHS